MLKIESQVRIRNFPTWFWAFFSVFYMLEKFRGLFMLKTCPWNHKITKLKNILFPPQPHCDNSRWFLSKVKAYSHACWNCCLSGWVFHSDVWSAVLSLSTRNIHFVKNVLRFRPWFSPRYLIKLWILWIVCRRLWNFIVFQVKFNRYLLILQWKY